MNCKPGDLAVVVGIKMNCPENAGRFVTVVRRAFAGESFTSTCGRRLRLITEDAASWVVQANSPLWWIDSKGIKRLFVCRPICDANLRPIRDNDGEDETLTWAGKPEKVSV